jgi:hypothetical protein
MSMERDVFDKPDSWTATILTGERRWKNFHLRSKAKQRKKVVSF